jgi:hypothetical protein
MREHHLSHSLGRPLSPWVSSDSGLLQDLRMDGTCHKSSSLQTGPLGNCEVISLSAYRTVAGNAFWVLSSPTWTWEFNATTNEWNERRSYGLTRWRGETSARAWGRWVVGDTQSTNVNYVGSQWMQENGDPLIPRAEGIMKDFPARIRVPVVDFDFTVGQGIEASDDEDVQDPQVALSWSHDGGVTWSNPLWRSLGRQGQHEQQIRLFNTGRSTPTGVRFAWEIADPVHYQFRGARVLNPLPRKP